jgi:16S rRNA processing protein RimM
LTVVNASDQILGSVASLMETGANDVLVVKGNDNSIDSRERLIPYVEERVVKRVDLTAGRLVVDWLEEF